MPISQHAAALFKGFSKLNRQERFSRLVEMGALTSDDVKLLQSGAALKPDLAENFIENVIGSFQMPLGVATNFRIDGIDYVIPMAVEESSIIAAASKTARWIRQAGEITTKTIGSVLIGQIQIANVNDIEQFSKIILDNKQRLMDMGNQAVASNMVKRGGGIKDITVRRIKRDDGKTMVIVHVHVDTCDAMGANVINQICEYYKVPIEALTGETVTMCILSNLNDQKLTRATVVIRGIEPTLGHRLEEASLFAHLDPYRAATHNKGVLNGMDAVILATGNDWRAVEAAVHAYAARKGQYASITTWKMQGNDLIGTLEAPIIVGTVGGVTRLHPMAKLSLNILGVQTANELARIIAAVGLVQNLGAIRALMTVGIVEGHMKLHIANLTIDAGAKEHEIPLVKKRLEEVLALRKRISLSNAIEILKELRHQKKKNTTKIAEPV